jgi:hypothetical protein
MARTTKRQIGTVGVDAGMLYLGDPCYIKSTPLGHTSDDPDGVHWRAFLESVSDPALGYLETHAAVPAQIGSHPFPAGIAFATRDGDGEFPVIAEYDSQGKLVSVSVRFK